MRRSEMEHTWASVWGREKKDIRALWFVGILSSLCSELRQINLKGRVECDDKLGLSYRCWRSEFLPLESSGLKQTIFIHIQPCCLKPSAFVSLQSGHVVYSFAKENKGDPNDKRRPLSSSFAFPCFTRIRTCRTRSSRAMACKVNTATGCFQWQLNRPPHICV